MRRFYGSTVLWIVPFVLCSAALVAQESVQITGTIRDQANGEPLRFVTVRALGTKAGTITAKDGAYVLQLAGIKLERARALDSLMLVFSLVGYRSDTVIVSLADQVVDVTLEEQAFRTRTVVVSGEDPGVRIMRRLLERKERQEDRRGRRSGTGRQDTRRDRLPVPFPGTETRKKEHTGLCRTHGRRACRNPPQGP